jgi:hypothetical protein
MFRFLGIISEAFPGRAGNISEDAANVSPCDEGIQNEPARDTPEQGVSLFDSALYDPNAAWRSESPSEAQLRLLTELGLPPTPGMTKGQASDLISRSKEPDPEQIAFLKFFGVKLSKSATQLDANQRIVDIVSDPANKTKCEARPATAEQKEIIRHVDGKVPVGITLVAADKLIRSYSRDEAKNHKHKEITAVLDERQAVDDAKESRMSFIRDHCENLNR